MQETKAGEREKKLSKVTKWCGNETKTNKKQQIDIRIFTLLEHLIDPKNE